jgi:hypothetical protein
MNTQSITPVGSNDSRGTTLTTRLTAAELRAVGAAAAAAGITRSLWLRNAALASLDQSDPTVPLALESTILAEVISLRLVFLNLFAAATPGLALETVHQIMNYAESTKHAEAAKIMRRSIENESPE